MIRREKGAIRASATSKDALSFTAFEHFGLAQKWICSHLIQNPHYAAPRVAR
jgi:hypothetical protein